MNGLLGPLGRVLLVAAAWLGVSATSAPAAEGMTVRFGLAIGSPQYVGAYLADSEGLYAREGIEVETTIFRGGSDLVRAVASGTVDIGSTGLGGVILAIEAEQDVKVFFAGSNAAPFEWLAIPEIGTHADARGRRFGVSRFGSLTDFLTRAALRRSGIDPVKEVTIVQGGRSDARLAAMESGQLDVNILDVPYNFIAAEKGFRVILRQSDLAPDFPTGTLFARQAYLDAAPDAVRAFLRAYSSGVALAKSDRARAEAEIVKRTGLEAKYASLAYDSIIGGLYEDGRLPSDEGMAVFWSMSGPDGAGVEPWPDERWLTRKWIDSYESWRP